MKTMKQFFYLVWAVCLMTGIALGADVSLIPNGIRLEDVRDSFVAPDLGVNIGKADMVQGKAVILHAGTSAAFWIRENTPLFKGG
ncbi:MAG: hypothetical protein BWK80_50595 [Desulfobacteraceae bacterium IS3]|nr:MAG: hypothetical protein BWK80_50595 [Desulfobacteraceae bacterium IS3]